jgi:thiosulfate reductase cytochrome b subunit
MHWTNVVALTILLMSGLQIFNAHPALYWAGKSSYTGKPAVLEIGVRKANEGAEAGYVGYTRIFGREFDTTGVLGLSKSADGRPSARGFPWWITIPDDPWLAMARLWHFFFAWVLLINGLVYVMYSAGSRHLSRDLAPDRRDWRSIGQSIKRSPQVSPSDRRRREALQRAAEAHLSHRDLRPAAADHPHGPRDEPVDELGAARLDRSVRRPAGGADDPFRCRLAARRLRRDPRVRGDRVRGFGTICARW